MKKGDLTYGHFFQATCIITVKSRSHIIAINTFSYQYIAEAFIDQSNLLKLTVYMHNMNGKVQSMFQHQFHLCYNLGLKHNSDTTWTWNIRDLWELFSQMSSDLYSQISSNQSNWKWQVRSSFFGYDLVGNTTFATNKHSYHIPYASITNYQSRSKFIQQ